MKPIQTIISLTFGGAPKPVQCKHPSDDSLPGYAGEELHRKPVDNTPPLDWDGPDDVDNPRNWPLLSKVLHSAAPAIYGFALTIGTSTFVAAVPYVMEQFKVGQTVALLPISLYTMGFTLGPLIAAPISELYGRRIIYWSNLPILVVFNAAAAASNNLAALIVLRFLAGFGGSGVLAVGAGTLADLWAPHHAGRAGLFYALAPFLGPALGPLIGAYIVAEYHDDWKYTIWVVLIICAPIAVAMAFLKETSHKRILQLRARRRGDTDAGKERASEIVNKFWKAMLRPFHMMISEPITSLLSIYTAFNFAMIFSFFGSYSYVYALVYHFNQKQIGLCYIGVVIGFLFALATFGYFDATKYRQEVAKNNGKPAPEHRLYAAMFGSVLLPIGLFWFAWSPSPSVHWIVPVLAGWPFGWGSLSVFLSSVTYLVDTYGASGSASAMAVNGFLRFLLGAVFPLFTTQMYKALGIRWAGSLFAFVSLALLPVPWMFYWKGKVMRERSAYSTVKY